MRYKSGREGGDLPNWLETHRGGTLIVDRKTGEKKTIYVRRAAVCVTGGIQPGVLVKALTADCLGSGLGARLLFAMPPRLPKRWSELEIHPDTEQAYHGTIDRLFELDFDREAQEEPSPHALQFSPDAKSLWIAFFDWWAEQQAAVEGELAAAFSKLEAYSARFALIHHCTTYAGRGESDLEPIGRDSVQAGIAMARWFGEEARRVYATIGENTESRDMRRLVEFIQSKGGKVTVRQLQNSNSRKYPRAQVAEAALEGLVASGLARWVITEGRDSRVLELLPTTDTSDT
jgi:hypothetical protein